ncbi:MAG: CAP domain-containing protein [Actinobacteria bacterium]|nr:CAP domain-containing protein [Actinomycetota bacterium]
MPEKSPVSSRRRPLLRVTVAAMALVVGIVVPAGPAGSDVSFINARRSAAGMAPVSFSPALASVARNHSQAMVNRRTLSHSSNLPAAVSAVLPGWQAVAENVGVGESLADVNAKFMTSAGHRANITGNYNLAGVGAVTGDDGQVWVTQVFARVPAAAAPATTAIARSPAPRPSASERPVQHRVSRSRVAPAPLPRAVPAPPPPPPPPPPKPATVAGMAAPSGGYQLIAADGGVFSFGGAQFAGSGAELGLNEPVVGGANTKTGDGYMLFGRRGGVFAFGSVAFRGSGSGLPLAGAVVGGSMSPNGLGYTLFTDDGGVFCFGDARFHGSAAGQPLKAPIVGGAVTPAGNGYWLVGADGGVYAFGNAPFLGSLVGAAPLRAPIVGMATTPTGDGYWLVSSDGGTFAFGDAPFTGSAADQVLPETVRALVAAQSGRGYWLVLGDQTVLPYGDLSVPERRRPADGPAARVI